MRGKDGEENWARQGNKKAKGKVKERLMNTRIGKSDGELKRELDERTVEETVRMTWVWERD